MDTSQLEKYKDMKHLSFLKDMVKYSFVSIGALIVDYGSLIVISSIGINYIFAATIAFILGTLVNYMLSHDRVFHQPVIKNKALNFTSFAAIGGIGLAFNNAIIWFFVSRIALALVLAKSIAVIVVFFWNFIARRELLYNGHKNGYKK